MHTRNVDDGFVYIGALLFTLIVNMFNGFAELSLTITRLPVFYKHRDLLFYPAWIFTLPNVVLRIPFSIIESIVWVVITYYTMGFAPEADRYIWSIQPSFDESRTVSSEAVKLPSVSADFSSSCY
jgi:hypothetical protein